MDVLFEESNIPATATQPSPKSRRPRRRNTCKQAESADASQASSTQDTTSSESIEIASHSFEYAPRRRTANPETIHKVESIVGRIADSIQNQDDNITISLRVKKSPTPPSSQPPARSSNDHYKISFPGSTPEEAWRFSTETLAEMVCKRTSSMLTYSPAVVLRILELIHEALVANIVISKRNIYYKDTELFGSQTIVDRYVDILAYTFGIPRAALNVTATAKGLAAGSFNITYHDGSSSSCEGHKDATVIDNVDDIRSIDISNTSWILVIEKEAKGYPDISTRAFLRLLSLSSYPPLPIYALVDFDPDGIAIMSTYKHGSLTLSHENANLKTPIIRWLGVKSQDLRIDKLNSGANGDEKKGLLKLSMRDRKKALGMLGKEICEEDGVEKEWRRELQVMLMLNIKVEMEILGDREGGIEEWVEEKLCNGRVRARG